MHNVTYSLYQRRFLYLTCIPIILLLNNNDKVLCLTACDDFTYGDNCSSSCGACRGLTSCDKETGLCAEGCEPEFVGQLCLGKLITSKHCYSKQALNEFKFHIWNLKLNINECYEFLLKQIKIACPLCFAVYTF